LRSIRSRMQALLAEIARSYDFSRFTMDGFKGWVEQQRGRRIVWVPWSMPPPTFGAWLAIGDCDYVFYEKDTFAVHQTHIRLHEMAHMLCDHPALEIDLKEAGILLRCADAASSAHESLLLRAAHSSEEIELEAETLTALIQERVLRYARLEELTTAMPSDDFATYFSEYLRTVEIDT
jgi:hypothetical protein